MRDNKNREEEDLDQSFLDDVLNKLYDFGDGPASKRKRKSQKKKKRKKGDEEDAEEDCCDTVDCLDEGRPQDSSGTNRLDSLETESTAPANQEQLPKVEVVTFQDPMKMRRVTKTKPATKPASALVKPPMKEAQQPGSEQLGKARLEVYRFGLTGYKKEQQRVFEQERAIMLGAKPPKRECVNYKVYQQTIKEKKEKAKEEAQTDKKKKKRKQRDEKQKSSSGGSAPTGQLGRFKNGMLVLNAQEVRRAGIKPRVSKSSQ